MKNILILSLSLGIVCTTAAVVLGFAQLITKDQRAEVKRQSDLAAIEKILPEFDNNPLKDKTDITIDDAEITVMAAEKDGEKIAYAVQAAAQGYGGPVEVLVGVKPNGDILHVVVLPGHQETPGLGTKATNRTRTTVITDFFGDQPAEKKTGHALAPNDYLDQYESHNLLAKVRYQVTKDGGNIDAISGATVSSRAVAAAISKAAAGFREFKQKLEPTL